MCIRKSGESIIIDIEKKEINALSEAFGKKQKNLHWCKNLTLGSTGRAVPM